MMFPQRPAGRSGTGWNFMASKTTYGLDLNRLKQLLSLGGEEDCPPGGKCTNGNEGHIPLEDLGRPLSHVSPVLEPLVAELKNIETHFPEGSDLQGQSLLDILLRPASPFEWICIIKDFGKRLSGDKIAENDRILGIVLYYASIASAGLFHGKKITQSSDGKLRDAFENFSGKSWVPADLKKLFVQARDVFPESGA
jgi:hypothetical protein